MRGAASSDFPAHSEGRACRGGAAGGVFTFIQVSVEHLGQSRRWGSGTPQGGARGKGPAGLPLFAVTVWGAHPTLSSHGGFIAPEYAVPGHGHAKLELGKQTLLNVTDILKVEIRELEVYEGQIGLKLSI